MGRILITSLVIYLLYVVGYLAWERREKRHRNGARKGGADQKRASPPDDIMGKSRFELRHSRPQATTLAKSEKREENDSTFADGKDEACGSKASVAIPKEKLDEAFSSPSATPSETDSSVDRETDSPIDPATDSATDSETDPPTATDEVDYAIDDTPEAGEIESPYGTDADGEKENVVDADESENAGGSGDDADDAAANGIAIAIAMATGLGFHELSGMSRTVNDPDAATAEQRHEAGRVLVEVRQTDMFEQIVSGPPQKRQTAGNLMDDYFAAWHRRRRETGGDNEQQAVRTPTDFDPRAFAGL